MASPFSDGIGGACTVQLVEYAGAGYDSGDDHSTRRAQERPVGYSQSGRMYAPWNNTDRYIYSLCQKHDRILYVSNEVEMHAGA